MIKNIFDKTFFAFWGTILAITAISFHYFIFIYADAASLNYMSLYPAKSTYVSYDESIIYWPKVSSILNGSNLNLADPYIKEYSNIKTHIPFGSELIIATIINKIGVSINEIAVIVDVLSITILYLMLYIFLNFITKKPFISMILGLMFIFSFDLYIAISALPSLTKLVQFFMVGNISILTRTSNLSISILPLIIFSYFFYLENLTNNTSKLSLNAMFLSSSLLAYFNVYMWTFSSVMIFSTYLIGFLYGRKIFNNRSIKDIILGSWIYVFTLIPFLILIYISYGQEGYEDYLARFGVAQTRSFHILTIGYVGLIVILYLLNKKIKNKLLEITIAIFTALIIAKNLQLILGYTVQTFHWSRDAAIPFFLLIFIFHLSKFNINSKIIVGLFVMFFSIFQISAYTYASSNWQNHVASDQEVKLYKYINENTDKSKVIASPWELSSTILNHSNRKVYIPHAPVSYANGNEITERLLDYYCAIAIDVNYFSKILDDKHSYYSIFHMNDVYHPATFSYFLSRESLNLRPPFFSKVEKKNMIDLLSECIIEANNGDFQMKYEVDYLITLNRQEISNFLANFPFKEIEGYRIFDLTNKS